MHHDGDVMVLGSSTRTLDGAGTASPTVTSHRARAAVECDVARMPASYPLISIMSNLRLRSLPSLPSVLTALLLACPDGVGPGERLLTLEVASTRVSCGGVELQDCLQVRWSPEEP